ncbi:MULTISPECIES: dihydrodipicolinate synthase family protein [Trueperella]|uniref:4-hydroxy-tetrahydrodipicolinate synthase n=1 Tax=Trueperella bernardiae TaxID=59561 RepID=A0A0W1KL56_9ACTO|nr:MULTISPECIES: dihydrodipicolinate synthase family protein [Trueperella]KTF04332.1 4-hydroxy-tetrahydrodipicolinate synthase [Trueperella bernardiae]MCM3906772.1 dihydrodipicolinate synthase family protein [Trueperella bernardiae]MDK8601400.1 dihydrodipicolinate synthase family protein [Trueperella bernardiae]MDV6238084.1 dihydrodipicolinate synthase family protein [Trueperella bernardiae]OCW60751.1 glucose dehydrogenase [Trueperella bernardiae]
MKIRGVVPPVVTPLTADGALDVASFERSINRMIDAGVDGLFVLGSSGEVVFSTDERRREVIENAVRIVAGRVPVLVGVIDMTTKRTIEHARVAKELGADAIVATAPFYAILGPKEIKRHFRLVHEEVDLPLFAYDIPVCVHVKLAPALILELAREGVLAGVKDSSGDDVSFRFLAQARDEESLDLALLTGHEVVVDGAYMSHADGSVPGLANVDPVIFVEQWRAYQAGDWGRVRELQDEATRLMRIVQVASGEVGFAAGVGAFKTALMLLGVFETNTMPEPVLALEGENVEAVARVLRETGHLN